MSFSDKALEISPSAEMNSKRTAHGIKETNNIPSMKKRHGGGQPTQYSKKSGLNTSNSNLGLQNSLNQVHPSNYSQRDDRSYSEDHQTAQVENNQELKIKEDEKKPTSENEDVEEPEIQTKISHHAPIEENPEHSAVGSRSTEKVVFRNSIKTIRKELTVG